MKLLLFGTGDYYNRYKKWFDGLEVLALLDNSKQKQHTVIDGFNVLPPAEGIKLDYDVIVILSFYVKQMKYQLLSLGVDDSKIFHFYDLRRILGASVAKRPIKYYGEADKIVACSDETVPRILLLSQDLTLGGPSIALFHAAMVLKKAAYAVLYASMLDGALREILLENNIPVVVDENLQIAVMDDVEWVKSFSLILCNTMNFHVFLSQRSANIPIIWWLHDARFFYDGVDRKVINKINRSNLHTIAVGSIPAEAINEFLPDIKCGELLYGVVDEEKGRHTNKEEALIRFITIGFLEDIKGQDILVQAIRRLPADIRYQCEFYIVGHNKTLFGEHIFREAENIPEIIFTGNVERQEIHDLLKNSDVLICPSRQDSMPTVVAEAMMHYVPCIVSDTIGTAGYIRNNIDGFIFTSGDTKELSDKIQWCIEHRRELDNIGRRSRGVYEQYFSMKVFEKNLLKIVKRMLTARG